MRCRNGVTEKLLSVTDTTALHSPKHPRNCVRRASGFVLTTYPENPFQIPFICLMRAVTGGNVHVAVNAH
jgi:hypothetical protein